MHLNNIYNIDFLKNFEKDLARDYLRGNVKPPVHFSMGNEEDLIKIFENIDKTDWVCSTHRNHYHALLKGIPPEYLIEEIKNGRSMQITSKEHKFITSSIVGGLLSIATGLALGIKRNNSGEKVWIFCGDMASETGIFYECNKYAKRNDLPIKFIIEDNGLSVNTPTQDVWGINNSKDNLIIKYTYKSIFPHQGCGKEVGF